jgi:hypothetical protein
VFGVRERCCRSGKPRKYPYPVKAGNNDELFNFFAVKNGWEPEGAFGPIEVGKIFQTFFQDFSKKENEGIQGLILCA